MLYFTINTKKPTLKLYYDNFNAILPAVTHSLNILLLQVKSYSVLTL